MEPTAAANATPWIPIALLAVGFVTAIGLGSLAWFNSKRPAGWENAERPGYVPKMGKDEPAESETQKDS